MEFRLLGPLEARDGDRPVALGGAKPRALLALLLLDARRTIPSTRLVDELWGEDGPPTARKMVQIHVSHLRRVLPADLLRTQAAGYCLEVDADAIDLARFERLAGEGRAALAAGDPRRAADRLSAALALWRGPALAEFDEAFAVREGARLEALRLSALEDRIDADLALGRHAALTAELDGLVRDHPQRERMRGQHMLALYRSGRQADALASYQDAWRRLGELGIQPSVELRELEAAILAHDPALAAPVASFQPAGATRYASNRGVSLAYRVVGEGPLELMLVTGWVLPMELFGDYPGFARFIERLGSFSRVLVWDKRGTGLSDRFTPGRLAPLEDRMEDMTAVLDAAGFERPAVFGLSEGTHLAALFAARHPERTRALALFGGWARTLRGADHPVGTTPEQYRRLVALVREHWGDAGHLLRYWAPASQHDERLRAWWSRALRLGASPTSAEWMLEMMAGVDLRDDLGSIRAPTLVMHREGDVIVPVENGRDLASRIPGARYLELPGADHLGFVGDQDALLDPLEAFLVGGEPDEDGVLVTVLWIAGAAEALVERHGGRVFGRRGDGTLAAFESVSGALRCALAAGDGVRAGVHTGECRRVGDGLTGGAVDRAAEIGALAEPGELLVSSVVAELADGSGLVFEPRGEGYGSCRSSGWPATHSSQPGGR